MAVEEIRFARDTSPLGLLHERHDVRVHLLGLAMIGVEGDQNRVSVGDSMDMLGDRDRAEHHVLYGATGGKRCASN